MENIQQQSKMSHFFDTLNDYYELCKPRVVMLIVFTTIIGMFLAVPGMVPFDALVFGTLGIGLAAASAAAINQIVDRRVDAIMSRTTSRPIPSGQISEMQALIFAISLCIISMSILILWVNMLTALLTFASLVGYAVIYTMFLKRATPQNIVIGGAAGAAPPVLGWVAVTNSVDPNSLLLFLIIFAWTPPHFWALAIHRRDEYAKVDIPMLPVTHGIEFTRLHVLLYTIILLLVSVLPFVTGMSGMFYFISALILGSWFMFYAILLQSGKDKGIAMKTFGFSIVYLMAIFTVLLVDHYIPAIVHIMYS